MKPDFCLLYEAIRATPYEVAEKLIQWLQSPNDRKHYYPVYGSSYLMSFFDKGYYGQIIYDKKKADFYVDDETLHMKGVADILQAIKENQNGRWSVNNLLGIPAESVYFSVFEASKGYTTLLVHIAARGSKGILSDYLSREKPSELAQDFHHIFVQIAEIIGVSYFVGSDSDSLMWKQIALEDLSKEYIFLSAFKPYKEEIYQQIKESRKKYNYKVDEVRDFTIVYF